MPFQYLEIFYFHSARFIIVLWELVLKEWQRCFVAKYFEQLKMNDRGKKKDDDTELPHNTVLCAKSVLYRRIIQQWQNYA